MTVALSSSFLESLVVLPRHIQAKVSEFMNKFRNNPTAPGINFEKLKDCQEQNLPAC